ncbi:alpha/beta hydrolase [Methanobrevibacter wolinii]|uniref:alpha/beta hydrolase n=1 Tax=Methanobrevibacter wolinii TaxID=190977 RepID=UPI0005B26F5E|nr:alpha/beta hydrolase family protein [Methanobrevibacter wolinii]
MALLNVEYKSQALGRNIPFTAILPVDHIDYEHNINKSDNGPYKTLYLLNGLYGDCIEWLTHTDIKRLAERNNLAVIMPSGENSFYLNYPSSNRNYSKYVGEELVNITRRMFNLSNKREDTFIGGYSMGGFGALYNGFKYNNTFSKIVALSSALILEDDFDKTNQSIFKYNQEYIEECFGNLDTALNRDVNVNNLIKKLEDSNKDIPDLFITCASDDSLYDANIKFVNFLSNYNNINYIFHEGVGGHQWDYWNKFMKEIVEWLTC